MSSSVKKFSELHKLMNFPWESFRCLRQIEIAWSHSRAGPMVGIIENLDFCHPFSLCGLLELFSFSKSSVILCRFNGCVFKKAKPPASTAGNSPKPLPYTCCAVGSRDQSVSIWLTSLRRPLVVIHDMFDNSVMDISW